MVSRVPEQSGRLTTHLRCIACGYDLYLQSTEGKCPECGERVRSSLGPGLGMPAFPLVIRQNLARHIRHVRWACLAYLAGAAAGPVAMGLEEMYLQWCIEHSVRPTGYPFREAAVIPLLVAMAALACMCTLTDSARALRSFVAPVLRWTILVLVLLIYLYAWWSPTVSVAEQPFIIAISLLTLVLLLYLSRLATAAGKRLLAMLAWAAAIPQMMAVPALCFTDLYANTLSHGGLVLLCVALPVGYVVLWVGRMSGASTAILRADAQLRFVATGGR